MDKQIILIIILVVSILYLLYKICTKKVDSNIKLKEELRKLFSDHAIYTKFVTTDILENLSNAKYDTERLIRNQSDIAQACTPIIGVNNGKILKDALTEHIQFAAACIKSLKENNSGSLDENKKKLFQNSAKVGAFLHSLNPVKLQLDVVTTKFNEHNQYVLDIATAQYNKDYQQVVILFDKYYNHMLMFSDMLYNALK